MPVKLIPNLWNAFGTAFGAPFVSCRLIFGVFWGLLGVYMGSLPPSNQPVRPHIEPEPSHEPSGGPRKAWGMSSSLGLSSSLFLSSNLFLSSSPGLFSSLLLSSSLFLFSILGLFSPRAIEINTLQEACSSPQACLVETDY